mmetsp:Transcript_8725/g.25086  ORF Transcript_8725/g.25086 Transcript_8725/m.25086 type:complete len:570 (-) Transcript_8725:221-1930(-)
METLRASNPTESRPSRESPPKKKKATFLQRISPHRRTAASPNGAAAASPVNHARSASVPSPLDTAAAAAAAESTTTSSPSPSSPLKLSRPPRIASPSFRSRILMKGSTANNQTIVAARTTDGSNVMHWLESDCPPDLLPKMMAYMGPKMFSTLSKVNRHWRAVTKQESTWKALCEELYKWKEGDAVPASWRQFYIDNPCVPIDCASLQVAIRRAGVDGSGKRKSSSMRIFIRPGRYILKEAITIQADNPDIAIQIETMAMPDTFKHPDAPDALPIQEQPPTVSSTRRRGSKLRRMLSCRSNDGVVDDDDDDDNFFADFPDPNMSVRGISSGGFGSSKRAMLMLRSRRHDEPLVRIRQGIFSLKNTDLYHISHGNDIWNGNAAVQIQPPLDRHEQPIMATRPRAMLEQVDVTSLSGRGIVNIDGGDVSVVNCHVHDCAATGIYVGGPGSRASIVKTDIVKNGYGNRHNRRGGIARGHSGIYLEQGHAKITDCNVSHNSLTGISVVSPDNAILTLSDSDLVSNGSFQLEMPPLGTIARRASLNQNNTMAAVGIARSRSGLVLSSTAGGNDE